MITVSELEKLESLIKEGALERPGRPISGDGIETLEVLPPLAADIAPPTEDIPPLIPMKGTLKRSAHTSMRNVRRGGLSAVRTARRSSESKKDNARMSQASVSDDDAILRPEGFDGPKISPTKIPQDTLPLYDTSRNDLYGQAVSLDLTDPANASAVSTPLKLDFQELAPLVPDIYQSPEPIVEQEEIVLGQVQPRQLRRPPLRRQTIEAPELVSTLQTPTLPPKDNVPEKTLKKSPVSPLFPTPEPPRRESLESQPQPTPPFPPSQPTLPIPAEPLAPVSQTPATPKKGAWSRLFTSTSDDDAAGPSKEKSQAKSKMKKAASTSERPKPTEIRQDGKTSVDLERGKTIPGPTPVTAAVPPTPAQAPQKQSGKKESGLFASIFGSKKKSQEPKEKSKSNDTPAIPNKSGARDRSQSQRNGPGGWGESGNGSMDAAPPLNFYYTRFPIHVERAIYRLSHIKLANPRRPLLQQVLLSNFMYGYLNLINKAAQPQPQEVPQPQPQSQETYDDSQSDEHVFYSQDDQNDYYNQDYYGSQYEDDQDDV